MPAASVQAFNAGRKVMLLFYLFCSLCLCVSLSHRRSVSFFFPAFDAGCQVLVLDGAHMRNGYQMRVLLAVGYDANGQMYVVAAALTAGGVVSVCLSVCLSVPPSLILAVALFLGEENNFNVSWFLTQLKRTGGLVAPAAIYTDRGKAFLSCVPEAYPDVPHRFCVVHLERNLTAKHAPGKAFTNLLWKLADAPTQADARRTLEEMRDLNPTATEYVETNFVPASAWQVSLFDSPHWGTRTSNQVQGSYFYYLY
jgi:hypothetical protein